MLPGTLASAPITLPDSNSVCGCCDVHLLAIGSFYSGDVPQSVWLGVCDIRYGLTCSVL